MISPSVDVRFGDAWDLAHELAPGSIDCVVTSPPYFGLRDYGTASWMDGDPACDHVDSRQYGGTQRSTLAGWGNGLHDGTISDKQRAYRQQYRDVCEKCGAKRVDAQLGIEASPAEYVARLVALFEKIRPALKDSGVVWLNLGDTYAGGRPKIFDLGVPNNELAWSNYETPRNSPAGYKDKDLILITGMVAIALQAAGWYLRADVIWNKPNPSPESAADRPTRAHEHIYLLTKSERYFYDGEAVREPAVSSGRKSKPAGWQTEKNGSRHDFRSHPGRRAEAEYGETGPTRNLRTVWTIPTFNFKGSHYATFPPELAKRCIMAGSSEAGVCSVCGAPAVRVVEKTREFAGGSGRAGRTAAEVNAGGKCHFDASNNQNLKLGPTVRTVTVGWRRTCDHDAELVPATVLDPFLGSGTTVDVARRLGRSSVGFELNETEYQPLIESRLAQQTIDEQPAPWVDEVFEQMDLL